MLKKYTDYEAVLEAKAIIEDQMPPIGTWDDVDEFLKYINDVYPKRNSVRLHRALITVLWTGTFVEDLRWGFTFMMPSTSDVMKTIAGVGVIIDKRQNLAAYVEQSGSTKWYSLPLKYRAR